MLSSVWLKSGSAEQNHANNGPKESKGIKDRHSQDYNVKILICFEGDVNGFVSTTQTKIDLPMHLEA